MILSRAWLHDTVSCAAWNDARKGIYLKPLFKTPCSNCYWDWSKPIYAGLQGHLPHSECAPTVEDRDRVARGNWTHDHFKGGGPYNWYLIHNVENSTFSTGWPPNTPYDCAEARKTQVADATFRDLLWYSVCTHHVRTLHTFEIQLAIHTYIIWHRIRPAKRRPVWYQTTLRHMGWTVSDWSNIPDTERTWTLDGSSSLKETEIGHMFYHKFHGYNVTIPTLAATWSLHTILWNKSFMLFGPFRTL